MSTWCGGDNPTSEKFIAHTFCDEGNCLLSDDYVYPDVEDEDTSEEVCIAEVFSANRVDPAAFCEDDALPYSDYCRLHQQWDPANRD